MRQWPSSEEPSTEADRIWRAIEMISDRQAQHDEADRRFHGTLPDLMKAAVADGIKAAASDNDLRETFWQSGVAHVGTLMRKEAGGTVLGLLWSGVKVAGLAVLVLVVVGPMAFKTLVAAWWGKP